MKCDACDGNVYQTGYVLDDSKTVCADCFLAIKKPADGENVIVPAERILKRLNHVCPGTNNTRPIWIRVSCAGQYFLCPNCHDSILIEFKEFNPIFSICRAVWIVAWFAIIQAVLFLIGFLCAIGGALTSPPSRY